MKKLINKRGEVSPDMGERVLSTTYKVSGWSMRIKAISSLIVGIILIIIGIVFAVYSSSYGALVLSVVGLIVTLGGWFMWWRAKPFVKGRYY